MVRYVEDTHKKHRLSLDDRTSGSITGICSVEAFDEESAVLRCEDERIHIKGQELHMTKLDVDRGEIEFSGKVDSISYQGINNAKKVAASVVKRMFK